MARRNYRGRSCIQCRPFQPSSADNMKLHKNHLSLIVLLLVTSEGIVSFTTEPTIAQRDEPYWLFILRGLVLSTMSWLESEEILHKKLLDAPFYGGPLPEVVNDNDALLSSGSVYRLPSGQWIFCQDDCVKCKICERAKNSTLTWILRRVRNLKIPDQPKWELYLTIMPQLQEEPHYGKSQATFILDKEEGDWWENQRSGNDDSGEDSIIQMEKGSRDVTKAKRYRSTIRPSMQTQWVSQYPQNGISQTNRAKDKLPRGSGSRLIMGIDQHGEKYLVHIVPMDSSLQEDERSEHRANYQRSHRVGASPRISRTLQESNDDVIYNNFIDRIVDSVNDHRNFIETFLFSHRLDLDIHQKTTLSPYSSYSEAITSSDKLQVRHEPSYRSSSPSRDSRYSINSEHRVEAEPYRHNPVTTREVNRPAGAYQDRSSMKDSESYGMYANDQHEDERSSPLADVERKRRQYSTELTDSSSTFGHQDPVEYYVQRDITNATFSTKKRIIAGNATYQAPGNRRTEINRTEPRHDNLLMESATASPQSSNFP